MRPAAEAIALVPERTADPLEHVDYRLAETPEDKDRIYRLRYRAYLREGAILPSESERVTDRYDDLPNNFTFGVYVQGELCSSIRISVLTLEYRGSPSSEMFTELLHPELDRGKVIIDPTRFVADPEKAKTFPELPYVTVRLGYVACGHFNADIGLANVRPEHRAFYRKVFLQEPWGEPKLYPGLIKPVGLVAAHYPSIREKVFQRFPYMRSSAFERRMLFQRRGERDASSPSATAQPPAVLTNQGGATSCPVLRQ
jgi:N-acyl-L-homoserine lactone synthetase